MSQVYSAFQENSRVWNDMQDHMLYLFSVAKGNVMEIGVRGGASTSALLAGVEAHGGHMWSVDVNPCKVFDHPQWTFTQANSITEAERIKGIIPDALDVLFVDGDHSHEGCLADLQNYGPRADLILIHDCLCPETFPGVRKASEEYAASLGIALEIREGSYGLGVINVPKAIRAALKIAGWMTPPELLWLAKQAAKHEVAVEVGCYQGRSTMAMAQAAKGIVCAVDDWKGLRENWWIDQTPEAERESLFERFTSNLKEFIDSGKVKVLRLDHALADANNLPNADFIFIDGDHRYESVQRDIQTWLPRLNPGGTICGHDANQPEVMQAVNELLPGAVTAVGLIWKWEKQ